MKNFSSKRALLLSLLSMIICVSMLIGSTFAWFTDSATANVNEIKSGNLAISFEMRNSENEGWADAKNATLNFLRKDETGNLVADANILWEPGCTFELPELKVENVGNLALKYQIVISGATNGNDDGKDGLKLLEVLKFTPFVNGVEGDEVNVKDGTAIATGELNKNGDKAVVKIKASMDTTANNDYKGLKISGISVKVVATQATYEYDSNGNTYDSAAQLPLVTTKSALNTTITKGSIPMAKNADGTESTTKHVPVEIALGDTPVEDIAYSENHSGYTGKGVLLGSTSLNSYASAPAGAGDYTFIFKDGTITSAATEYASIDGLADTSVYMLVPGNSDVVFENMVFNGVVSFDIQMFTSPWSYLNSITFKNCVFNGIIVGSCPANKARFDGCTFNNYTNTTYANNSNPIWWRAATGYWGAGSGESVHSLEEFVFVNNNVTSTRPVKIERVGWNCTAKVTIMNNTFDISAQAGDTETKNMAINIGQKDSTSKLILVDEGNTISANTASLYTAALGSGSNQYIAVSGSKVLDGNGNEKVITAMVWKTTTGETFELKSID